MAEIRTLKDYDDNIIYPQSITNAIVNAEGVSLETINQSFISSIALEEAEEIKIEYENIINKVLTINNRSTDEEYPSAKAVYDLMLANKDVGIGIEVVDSLPTENIDTKTIYLMQLSEGTYGMYVYANEEWREVGNTEIDLSNYATKDEIPTKVSQLNNDKNYATVSQIPDISNLAEKTEIPTKVSQLSNDKNYATVSQIPDVSGFATKTELSAAGVIPTGLICMWSGSTVPTGWALCNGTNGTPDLRDRFIVGSGKSYAIGTIGGSNTVTLTTAQMPSHTHTGTTGDATVQYRGVMGQSQTYLNSYEKGYPMADKYDNGGKGTISLGTHTHTFTTSSSGSGSSHENRPPYYALAFIMKI
jgi:microcystin-dependent protein